MKKNPFPANAYKAIEQILTSEYSDARCIFIMERSLHALYDFPCNDHPVLLVPGGECVKNIYWLKKLLALFTNFHVDRSIVVIVIGGGALCDAAGFAASIYMRGIDTVLVPTTLLAQVDAAYGGKTGINFGGIKNLIGTFHNPQQIIADPAFLMTLSKTEYYSGLGEVIKYAVGFDANLFSQLQNSYEHILNRNLVVVDATIKTCVAIKTSIVQTDPYEHNERRLLNLGHTFGHAFEQTLHIPHGHAVVLGILASAKVSYKLGLLAIDTYNRITNLIKLFGFSTKIPHYSSRIMKLISHDKKHHNTAITFIALEDIGRSCSITLEIKRLKELLYE